MLFFLLSFVACSTHLISVEHAGELYQIMHEDNIGAKIALSDVVSEKNIYGLGAVEGLEGEILILDSELFLSQEVDGAVEISNDVEKNATLLVYSQVKKWKKRPLDLAQTQQSIEDSIAQLAQAEGLSLEEPFVFQLRGVPKSLEWHVINWEKGMEHSHEAHIRSGAYGVLKDSPVVILGFHSTKHTAIWTHHSSNVHMHVLSENQEIAGHVDELQFDSMELWLAVP